MNWIDLLAFVLLALLFVYVLFVNEIKQLHKVYILFHLAMLLWPYGLFSLSTASSPSLQWFYLNLAFGGFSLLAYSWFIFSLLMTHRFYGVRKSTIFCAALPAITTIVLISTNPFHGFFAQPVNGDYNIRTYGPVLWVLIITSLSYIICSYIVMLRAYLNVTGRAMRRQIVLFMIGLAALTLCSIGDYVINSILFTPPLVPGLTSLGIIASYFCFAVALQRYSMYKVLSLAYRTIVDSIDTGIVVVNDQNIMIDANRIARRFVVARLGYPFPVEMILGTLSREEREAFMLQYGEKDTELEMEINDLASEMQHVMFRMIPVFDPKGIYMGRVITLQDVTEWRTVVEELNRKNEDLSQRNKELTIIKDELSEANKKLELMATTDSLTGCYNRRYLLQMMEFQIGIEQRHRTPFSVILFDIDYFKLTNDTYGHQIGDEVLRQTAMLVSSRLRKTDVFARHGGEEFVIFLPHTPCNNAANLGEEIRQIVESNWIKTEKGDIAITISMGITSANPGEEEQLAVSGVRTYIMDILGRADAALYEAKNSGRNRVVVI